MMAQSPWNERRRPWNLQRNTGNLAKLPIQEQCVDKTGEEAEKGRERERESKTKLGDEEWVLGFSSYPCLPCFARDSIPPRPSPPPPVISIAVK